MNPIASLKRRIASIALICSLAAGVFASVPAGVSATSIAAAHAPGSTINVALGQQESGPAIAVSRSVGLMDDASGPASQAQLGAETVMVTRSVGLMAGANGTATQADLGHGAIVVTRSIGLMEGARA